jgi:hypothetical protein
MKRLTAMLRKQQTEGAKLDAGLAPNLPACRNFGEGRKERGYGG